MKIHSTHLISAFLISLVSLTLKTSVNAQEHQGCFAVSGSGAIIDLSHMCGNSTDSIESERTVTDIIGNTTTIGVSNSPLVVVQQGIVPCSQACFEGINDYDIVAVVRNDDTQIRQVHAIEYNLILTSYNQVIDTGYVANTGVTTLRPGETATLYTSISSNIIPSGTTLDQLEVILLEGPLER